MMHWVIFYRSRSGERNKLAVAAAVSFNAGVELCPLLIFVCVWYFQFVRKTTRARLCNVYRKSKDDFVSVPNIMQKLRNARALYEKFKVSSHYCLKWKCEFVFLSSIGSIWYDITHVPYIKIWVYERFINGWNSTTGLCQIPKHPFIFLSNKAYFYHSFSGCWLCAVQ